VVKSEPGAEFLAERRIREAGFRVYLPTYRVALTGHRKERGRGDIIPKPLFVGYLFVEVSRGQNWHPVKRQVGVARDGVLMRDGLLPHLIPEALIEKIRREEQDGRWDRFPKRIMGKRGDLLDEKTGKALVGMELRVTDGGPWDGFIGKLDDVDDRGRVRVLLSIFGRQTPRWMKDAGVEPIQATG
jgi:transcription antitermination factor NusG